MESKNESINIEVDAQTLRTTAEAVKAAGKILLTRFPPASIPKDRNEVFKALQENDEASLSVLKEALRKARPEAQWVEDEGGTGNLPLGEWWVTDPVEGNINLVHGMTEWCITATLVRDNLSVLTTIYVPLTDSLYTASIGQGAFLNGKKLNVSAKFDFSAAYVGTGQAIPGEPEEIRRFMGESTIAMLKEALLVKVSVPATSTLLQVAAGHMDVFWQNTQVRSGLLAGALLVQEAGGVISDMSGRPWTMESPDFLASAPKLHNVASRILQSVKR